MRTRVTPQFKSVYRSACLVLHCVCVCVMNWSVYSSKVKIRRPECPERQARTGHSVAVFNDDDDTQLAGWLLNGESVV